MHCARVATKSRHLIYGPNVLKFRHSRFANPAVRGFPLHGAYADISAYRSQNRRTSSLGLSRIMSASLIGRSWSSAFRLPTAAVLASLAGSRFHGRLRRPRARRTRLVNDGTALSGRGSVEAYHSRQQSSKVLIRMTSLQKGFTKSGFSCDGAIAAPGVTYIRRSTLVRTCADVAFYPYRTYGPCLAVVQRFI